MNPYPPPDLSPTEFEQFVMRELDAIGVRLTDYRSSHLEVLRGRDGEYEIDITVRFSALDVEYLTLIECKHHRSPVKREHVQVLYQKVLSCGAHKGIVYSTSGFQSGAISFAKEHRVALVGVADGRTSYSVKSLGAQDRLMSWDQVPREIPRVIGWLIDGDSMTLTSTRDPNALAEFLGLLSAS